MTGPGPRFTGAAAKVCLVATRILTNGEFDPPPQMDEQRLEEQRTLDLADDLYVQWIDWVSDLAEIPARDGLTNVYAEIGTAFAASAVSHPRHAEALLGILIKGMRADHVLWGTDSVWYGSPQWEIEAFRRIEIPEDMREKYFFAPLGGARSEVKRKIMWDNGIRLYGIETQDAQTVLNDRFAEYQRGSAEEQSRLLSEIDDHLDVS